MNRNKINTDLPCLESLKQCSKEPLVVITITSVMNDNDSYEVKHTSSYRIDLTDYIHKAHSNTL